MPSYYWSEIENRNGRDAMIENIRKRLTYLNVLMAIALVLAMSGGAYAASKYIITSIKQIKPSVVAQLKGKNGTNGKDGTQGPVGERGLQGPGGPEGKKGEPGTDGANGATGPPGLKGATGPQGLEGNDGKEGPTGPKGVTGPAGVTGPTGVTGSPWTVGGVLPSGQSEKGVWGMSQIPGTGPGGLELAVAGISIPIPLSTTLPFTETPETNRVHIITTVGGKGEGKFEKPGKEGPNTGCPTTGSVTKPEAEPGNLCIYAKGGSIFFINITQITPKSTEANTAGAGRTGTLLEAVPTEAGKSVFAEGTWAVTAA
jgi:hypothetical protein